MYFDNFVDNSTEFAEKNERMRLRGIFVGEAVQYFFHANGTAIDNFHNIFIQ